MTHHTDTDQNPTNPTGPATRAEFLSQKCGAACEDDHVQRRSCELGFSLNEVLIVIAVIGILSVAAIGETFDAIEKARLAACMANMVTIRETVFENCDGGMEFPEADQLWNDIFGGVGPRGYWFELDNDDPNRGHGNDLDGFDEQNPGKAPRTDANIYFVLACTHNHKRFADYVYLEDEGSPQIAMGRDKPRWDRFYRKANR